MSNGTRIGAGGGLPRSILYWRETTDAQPFETGIQRVTRRLADGLIRRGIDVVPVGWDPVRRLMRRSRTRTGLEVRADWLLLPEIPMMVLSKGLDPIQLARAYGLRAAAIVHDLIPIRFAQLYPPEQQTLYRRYFQMFADADLVFATTQLVAGHLRAYLRNAGLRVPEIVVIPLPGQFASLPRVSQPPSARAPDEPLRLLTVSTFEPRKNLPGLLRAVRAAQERGGVQIHLTLVGRRGDHVDHDATVDALLTELPGCGSRSRLSDAELAGLFTSHHASVYPSCEEGFGMPVLESLWLGRPCLCHTGSAMAEVAPGGGALAVDMANVVAVAGALVGLADEPGLLDRLAGEALARPLRAWDDYAADFVMQLFRNRAGQSSP